MLTLFWFRQDLRLFDNPGLYAAAQNGSVLPIYILDDAIAGEFEMGAASRWWLHHSLQALDQQLHHHLNVYVGNPATIISTLLKKYPIEAVYWNRSYEPWRISSDRQLKERLKKQAIDCQSFNASLLWEPWEILKDNQEPYKVFTPFYHKACQAESHLRKPISSPKNLHCIKDKNNKKNIHSLGLLPKISWDQTMQSTWKMGEKAAQHKWKDFLDNHLTGYKKGRDFPAKSNVSRLSPHLHFGEISPVQLWHDLKMVSSFSKHQQDIEAFQRELTWREFSYYLLYHFPDLPRKNFQKKFDHFEWNNNKKLLQAWQHGRTGYPLVDAGMRELWQTGYMHNRVRMVVASFLVKNLLQHWHYGENWFWDCLVDADLANNSASWQWVAGSGADAAPYFRIFNPTTQGETYDREGIYTRQYVPELQHLPNRYLFKPWKAPKHILDTAGVVLGKTYPTPIIDLAQSRNKALEIYKKKCR